MRAAVTSTSLTPTYPSQLGRMPSFLASSGRSTIPLTEVLPAVNSV